MNNCIKCLQTRLERADELVKIAYERANNFDGFVENDISISPIKIEALFINYLEDYGLVYE